MYLSQPRFFFLICSYLLAYLGVCAAQTPCFSVEESLETSDLSRRERTFWQEANPSPRLISRVLEDENGEVTLCNCFYYNDQGQLIKQTLAGNLSGHCPIPCKIGEEGYPQANGVETYSTTYVYSEEEPTLLIAQLEDNGLRTDYQYDFSSKQCTAILRSDQKEVKSRWFYSYDNQGFLEQALCDDGVGQQFEDLTGVTQRQTIRLQVGHQFPLIGKPLKIENFYWEPSCSDANGELIYEMCFTYDQQGELVSTIDNQGGMAIKVESLLPNVNPNTFPSDAQPGSLNVDYLCDYISINQIWDRVVQSFFSCFQYLQFSAHQTRMKWNAELKLPSPIAQALEKISKTLFGESTYLLMGPHFEETHLSCYGQRELSDKVRVTFINGILNTRSIMLETLDIISESHGGVKVHYVFRPTEGWTWDISRAIMIRTAFTLGFRSLHAHLLAQMWRDLIQEMGGVEGGGVIMHYAHSLGGSETDRARELLTPEEQKMIRVVTFGSATLIRNVGFQSVLNIVSLNDGVSLLEPFGHIRNYFDPNTNIRFYGSFFYKNSAFPFSDHLLNGATYGPILLELGEKFLAEFKPDPNA